MPEGTPIKAAEDGTVAYAGNELKGYGNLVLIRHADGYVSAYANASKLLVKRGEQRQARAGDRARGPDRQRYLAATAFRDPQRLDAGRSAQISERCVSKRMIPNTPVSDVIGDGNRSPAFAKPASAGESRPDMIMRAQNVRKAQVSHSKGT